MNLITKLFAKSTPKKYSIFIVEDNESYAKLLEEFLMLHFPKIYSIKKFTTGEECLKKIHQKPTIVILDHLLNKDQSGAETGLSIVKKIKEVNANTHVILLSAQTEIEVVSKTIAKYGGIYIKKNEEAFNKIEQKIKQFLKEQ